MVGSKSDSEKAGSILQNRLPWQRKWYHVTLMSYVHSATDISAAVSKQNIFEKLITRGPELNFEKRLQMGANLAIYRHKLHKIVIIIGLTFQSHRSYTRIGTLIVATIYLQLIQNRYMFRSFTVLQCSHQHCVQPVARDVEVVGYL